MQRLTLMLVKPSGEDFNFLYIVLDVCLYNKLNRFYCRWLISQWFIFRQKKAVHVIEIDSHIPIQEFILQ